MLTSRTSLWVEHAPEIIEIEGIQMEKFQHLSKIDHEMQYPDKKIEESLQNELSFV